jgi:hypothetical protein
MTDVILYDYFVMESSSTCSSGSQKLMGALLKTLKLDHIHTNGQIDR